MFVKNGYIYVLMQQTHKVVLLRKETHYAFAVKSSDVQYDGQLSILYQLIANNYILYYFFD